MTTTTLHDLLSDGDRFVRTPIEALRAVGHYLDRETPCDKAPEPPSEPPGDPCPVCGCEGPPWESDERDLDGSWVCDPCFAGETPCEPPQDGPGAVAGDCEGQEAGEGGSGAQGPVWAESLTQWCAARPGYALIDSNLYAAGHYWHIHHLGNEKQIDPDLRSDAGSLAANIRAATAAWNERHPDRPCVVPEQFRDSGDGVG